MGEEEVSQEFLGRFLLYASLFKPGSFDRPGCGQVQFYGTDLKTVKVS